MTEEQRKLEHGFRLELLEKSEKIYNEKIDQIFQLLKRIETRLLGSIEDNRLGLIAEVREIKVHYENSRINCCQTEKKIEKELKDLHEANKMVSEKLEDITKYKWIFITGFAIIWGIITNWSNIIEFLKKA